MLLSCLRRYMESFRNIHFVFLEKNSKKCKNRDFQGISLCLASILPLSFISIVMKLGKYVANMYKKIYGKFQKNSLCNLGKIGAKTSAAVKTVVYTHFEPIWLPSLISMVIKLSTYVTYMYTKIHGKFQKNSLCIFEKKWKIYRFR